MAGRRMRSPRAGRGRHAHARRAGDGGAIPDFEAHRRAVETVVGALKEHRNWYLDLANERDVRDARHVPAEELKSLRELVRRLDPDRLVTASFGGHDLGEADLREALLTVGLDFVAPHRPRDAESPGQTEARTRECLATMKAIGRLAPVHYQEPFRRGYGGWEPSAADFLADLRGAWRAGPPAGASTTAPAAAPRRTSAALVRPPRPAALRPARRGGAGGRRPGRGGDASATSRTSVPSPFRLARPPLYEARALRPDGPGGPGPRRRPRLRLRWLYPRPTALLVEYRGPDDGSGMTSGLTIPTSAWPSWTSTATAGSTRLQRRVVSQPGKPREAAFERIPSPRRPRSTRHPGRRRRRRRRRTS